MRSLEGALIQNDWCPYIEGKFGRRTDMHRGKMMWTHTVSILREDKGRCWSDTFTSQRWSAHHQELGARHRTGPPSQLRKGTDTVNTLVWTSSIQNCETIHFCCVSHPVFGTCDGSSRKVIHSGREVLLIVLILQMKKARRRGIRVNHLGKWFKVMHCDSNIGVFTHFINCLLSLLFLFLVKDLSFLGAFYILFFSW